MRNASGVLRTYIEQIPIYRAVANLLKAMSPFEGGHTGVA